MRYKGDINAVGSRREKRARIGKYIKVAHRSVGRRPVFLCAFAYFENEMEKHHEKNENNF